MKRDTKLKDFRNRTGLEQKEMAKEIHVSPSYYCKVEKELTAHSLLSKTKE